MQGGWKGGEKERKNGREMKEERENEREKKEKEQQEKGENGLINQHEFIIHLIYID